MPRCAGCRATWEPGPGVGPPSRWLGTLFLRHSGWWDCPECLVLGHPGHVASVTQTSPTSNWKGELPTKDGDQPQLLVGVVKPVLFGDLR